MKFGRFFWFLATNIWNGSGSDKALEKHNILPKLPHFHIWAVTSLVSCFSHLWYTHVWQCFLFDKSVIQCMSGKFCKSETFPKAVFFFVSCVQGFLTLTMLMRSEITRTVQGFPHPWWWTSKEWWLALSCRMLLENLMQPSTLHTWRLWGLLLSLQRSLQPCLHMLSGGRGRFFVM